MTETKITLFTSEDKWGLFLKTKHF